MAPVTPPPNVDVIGHTEIRGWGVCTQIDTNRAPSLTAVASIERDSLHKSDAIATRADGAA